MSPKEIRKICRDIEDNFYPKGKLLSADEVCEILHISKSTLYKRTSRFLIPMHKIPEGHQLLFYENELHEWIKRRGRKSEV